MHLLNAPINDLVVRLITGTIYCLVFWTIFLFLAPIFFSLFLMAILAIILCNEWPKLMPFNSFKSYFFAFIYLIIPFTCMVLANHTNHRILGLLFLLVMAHDTGAYLVGRFLGKHVLCPEISPKKSWEGLMGGFIAVLVMLAIIGSGPLIQPFSGPFFGLILATIVTVTATTGDLFESWLKRCVGLKDTGTLLPGHGGLLDRFDSMIFLIVTYYLLQPFFVLLR